MAEPSANTFTGLSWLKSTEEMEIIKNFHENVHTRQPTKRRQTETQRNNNRLHLHRGAPAKLFLSRWLGKCFILKLL